MLLDIYSASAIHRLKILLKWRLNPWVKMLRKCWTSSADRVPVLAQAHNLVPVNSKARPSQEPAMASQNTASQKQAESRQCDLRGHP